MEHKFPYKWLLKDGFPAKGIAKHNLKNFGTLQPKYLIGMSVPPVMVAQIATEISNQWLTKINN